LEDPDSAAQLPLPSLPDNSTARVIRLHPRGGAKSLGNAATTTKDAGSDHCRSDQQTTNRQTASKRNCLWYALYFPQLGELNKPQQEKYLHELAGLVQSVSSTVSFHPLTLICEIRSSLKYFAGIDVIHNKLKRQLGTQLSAWGLANDFLYAASPTVTASLLLARSGRNTLVYQKENLRSALGKLPTEVLDLDKEQRRRLYNMGVRHLSDIWRLPGDGLRKRFGSNFVNQLNKALGKVPEPTRNYLPPPAFATSCELPYELENLDRLLPLADEMLAQLCDFLRRRDLATSHLLFSLSHEKRSSTKIELGLRQASRSQEHLMLLLETRFSNLTIPAPVSAIKVEAKNFDAFSGHSDSLLITGKPATRRYNDSKLSQFIEQLQSRLGEHHVKRVNNLAEHCPEYASQQFNLNALNDAEKNKPVTTEQTASNPRPFWLLQDPVQLTLRKGKLYHRKTISLVSGPERIETYWWSGSNIRRDYYVAREANGSRLWIYREKGVEKNWYLHGFFA
jgi:protein ImuB